MSNPHSYDEVPPADLVKRVNSVRQLDGKHDSAISVRGLSSLTGITASTLSRILRGLKLESHHEQLKKLSKWLLKRDESTVKDVRAIMKTVGVDAADLARLVGKPSFGRKVSEWLEFSLPFNQRKVVDEFLCPWIQQQKNAAEAPGPATKRKSSDRSKRPKSGSGNSNGAPVTTSRPSSSNRAKKQPSARARPSTSVETKAPNPFEGKSDRELTREERKLKAIMKRIAALENSATPVKEEPVADNQLSSKIDVESNAKPAEANDSSKSAANASTPSGKPKSRPKPRSRGKPKSAVKTEPKPDSQTAPGLGASPPVQSPSNPQSAPSTVDTKADSEEKSVKASKPVAEDPVQPETQPAPTSSKKRKGSGPTTPRQSPKVVPLDGNLKTGDLIKLHRIPRRSDRRVVLESLITAQQDSKPGPSQDVAAAKETVTKRSNRGSRDKERPAKRSRKTSANRKQTASKQQASQPSQHVQIQPTRSERVPKRKAATSLPRGAGTKPSAHKKAGKKQPTPKRTPRRAKRQKKEDTPLTTPPTAPIGPAEPRSRQTLSDLSAAADFAEYSNDDTLAASILTSVAHGRPQARAPSPEPPPSPHPPPNKERPIIRVKRVPSGYVVVKNSFPQATALEVLSSSADFANLQQQATRPAVVPPHPALSSNMNGAPENLNPMDMLARSAQEAQSVLEAPSPKVLPQDSSKGLEDISPEQSELVTNLANLAGLQTLSTISNLAYGMMPQFTTGMFGMNPNMMSMLNQFGQAATDLNRFHQLFETLSKADAPPQLKTLFATQLQAIQAAKAAQAVQYAQLHAIQSLFSGHGGGEANGLGAMGHGMLFPGNMNGFAADAQAARVTHPTSVSETQSQIATNSQAQRSSVAIPIPLPAARQYSLSAFDSYDSMSLNPFQPTYTHGMHMAGQAGSSASSLNTNTLRSQSPSTLQGAMRKQQSVHAKSADDKASLPEHSSTPLPSAHGSTKTTESNVQPNRPRTTVAVPATVRNAHEAAPTDNTLVTTTPVPAAVAPSAQTLLKETPEASTRPTPTTPIVMPPVPSPRVEQPEANLSVSSTLVPKQPSEADPVSPGSQSLPPSAHPMAPTKAWSATHIASPTLAVNGDAKNDMMSPRADQLPAASDGVATVFSVAGQDLLRKQGTSTEHSPRRRTPTPTSHASPSSLLPASTSRQNTRRLGVEGLSPEPPRVGTDNEAESSVGSKKSLGVADRERWVPRADLGEDIHSDTHRRAGLSTPPPPGHDDKVPASPISNSGLDAFEPKVSTPDTDAAVVGRAEEVGLPKQLIRLGGSANSPKLVADQRPSAVTPNEPLMQSTDFLPISSERPQPSSAAQLCGSPQSGSAHMYTTTLQRKPGNPTASLVSVCSGESPQPKHRGSPPRSPSTRHSSPSPPAAL